MPTSRREFLQTVGVGAAASLAVAAQAQNEAADLAVDPTPQYELSPYLYMQFMEPLGTTDGSVAASWDFGANRWREDLIEATRELGPTMVRWGGCLISYYRWREAVGPRAQRTPMHNLCWGGIDTNQIGTREFVDFCKQVDAEPLMCVNLQGDGKSYWYADPEGRSRIGDVQEAADWVRYCNDPDSPERRGHGVDEPHPIRMWQLGNETSYGSDWDAETAGRKTFEFARAMRAVDPGIQLIGWGDSGWASTVAEIAGDELDYVAFHHMFNSDHGLENSPLQDVDYRKDPAWTWERLMAAWEPHDAHIRWMRDEMGDSDIPLALTECHFTFPGRNRCEVLSTWAAGVAYARLANVHERHGDRLKIATLADFCGTRWQVNAIMVPVPGGHSYLMPVAEIMALYRWHSGEEAVRVTRVPDNLDVTASRTGDTVYLHVVNTHRRLSTLARLGIEGSTITGGRVFELAGDPEHEITDFRPDSIKPVEKPLAAGSAEWRFPPASVTAVELTIA